MIMKKLFTLILMFAIVLSAGAVKKIAYLTKDGKVPAAGAAESDNDAVIQIIKADANYELTIFKCDASGNDVTTSAPVNFTGFDVIVAQETFGSGDAVWKTGNPLYLGSLPLPTLYNKVYALRSGRALTTGSGASVDAGVLNMTIAAGQESHPIFAGITATGGSFPVSKGGVTDDGADGTKTVQYNTGNVVSGNTLLAYPEGGVDAVIAVNDMPAGTTIDDATLSSRVIMLDFNFGQLIYGGTGNLTPEGLLLWKNALNILANTSGSTSNQIVKSDDFNVSFTGSNLTVNFGTEQEANVFVYTIAGKLIGKQMVNGISANVEMAGQTKGIYLVKVLGEKINGTQKFVVR